MGKQNVSSITLMDIIVTIALFSLVSGQSTSLSNSDYNIINNGENNDAFAQQTANGNFTGLQDTPIPFFNDSWQAQGQEQTMSTPPNTTISTPNQTQQTQGPLIKPFTIPTDDEDGSTGMSNFYVSRSARYSNESDTGADIVLLSQSYNSEESGDRIVGEVLNNGIGTAQSVKVSASLYNQNGSIVDFASSNAQPTTVEPGSKAAFSIPVSVETTGSETRNYELTLNWKDTQHSVRVIGVQAEAGELRDNGNITDTGEAEGEDTDTGEAEGEDTDTGEAEGEDTDTGEAEGE